MTNIQVEDLSDVKKKVTVEVPQDKVLELLDSQYRDLKKTVQIKGFRKGKVPLEILRSYFKTQVEADTAKKIIEDTLESGLEEKKIVMVSVVKIDPDAVEAGKPFKYTAEIEVPPSIEVRDYTGLKLKKTRREVGEKQVEERLQSLRERNARLSPIPESRGVKEGDHLVVDVKAEAEGNVIPALTVTDYHMELGRNFYLPDFDSKLVGLKPDETKQISMELPSDFPRKNLAGKAASFELTVKEAKERILPDLDDDFAKDLGEFESLEQVRAEITEDLRKLAESQSKKEIENQIVDLLIEKNAFEVPESMVENQVDHFLNQSIQSLVSRGIDPKRLPAPSEAQREQIRPSAVRTVKGGLVMRAIAEQEKIEVNDEELQAGIEERAGEIGLSVDYLKDQLESNNMLEELRASLLQDKVYKLIQEAAEITEQEPPSESEKAPTDETEKE
ncbi:MAG: trigger factor [Desulfomonile tiedjei]|nr:trigger factor [Desulfomonile tiedjei]